MTAEGGPDPNRALLTLTRARAGEGATCTATLGTAFPGSMAGLLEDRGTDLVVVSSCDNFAFVGLAVDAAVVDLVLGSAPPLIFFCECVVSCDLLLKVTGM